MKLRLITIASILLMHVQQSTTSEHRKAPRAGDHILNPASFAQVLENKKKLEDDNVNICGMPRPDIKDLPTTLTLENKKQIQENMNNLKLLDQIPNWEEKDIKNSSKFFSRIFFDRFKNITNFFTQRNQIEEPFADIKKKLENNNVTICGSPRPTLNELSNKPKSLERSQLKKNILFLKFLKEMGYLKKTDLNNEVMRAFHTECSLLARSVHGMTIELTIQKKEIPEDKIEEYVKSNLQKEKYLFAQIQPLDEWEKENNLNLIDFYINNKDKAFLNDPSGLDELYKTCPYGTRNLDVSASYIEYLKRIKDVIDCENIKDNEIEDFLKKDFKHRNVTPTKKNNIVDNDIKYYLHIRKVYKDSGSRLKHFEKNILTRLKLKKNTEKIASLFSKISLEL